MCAHAKREGAEGVYGQENSEKQGTASDPVESAQVSRISGIRPKRCGREEIRQSWTEYRSTDGWGQDTSGQEAQEGRHSQADPGPRRDPQRREGSDWSKTGPGDEKGRFHQAQGRRHRP